MNGDAGLGGHRRRLPSVDEALRFMPFTSIVPFDAEMIPAPSALPPSLQSSVLSPQEVLSFNDTADQLNQAISASGSTSTQLAHALQSTRELLNSAELTRYKFKALSFGSSSNARKEESTNSRAAPRIVEQLSPFARRVLKETKVSYRAPSLISSSRISTPQAIKCQNKGVLNGATTSGTEFPRSEAQDTSRHKPSNTSAVKSVQEPAQRQMAYVSLPVTPMHVHQNARVVLESPKVDAHQQAISAPKPLLQNPNRTADEDRQPIIDKQNRFELARDGLEMLLNDLFQADDQLEPDTSGSKVDKGQAFFESAEIDGQERFIIVPEVQTKLLNAVAKVVNLGTLNEIPVQRLIRVQRLCQRSQDAANGISLELPASESDDEVDAWSERIRIADSGFRAGRTLIKIMMGGLEDKQLLSEDALRALLTNLKHVLENCIVPVVEARASGKPQSSTDHHVFFQDNPKLRNAVAALMRRAGGLMKAMGDLIMHVGVSEESIAAVEMLCVHLLFVENAASEKEAILGVGNFEDTRRTGMETLAKVFLRYPDPSHRRSILNEILASLEKLPIGRQSARQYKVANGKPIQVVSALVMLLVQISATRSSHSNHGGILDTVADASPAKATSDVSESEDELASAVDVSKANRASHLKNGQMSSHEYTSTATLLFESAKNNANYIVNFLLSRAQKVSKSSDEPFRNLLDIFTEDLVSVLGHPDWPAAELLLHHLFAYLGRLAVDDKTTAPVKVMALELLGSLGSGIADIQSYIARAANNMDTEATDLDSYLTHFAQEYINTGTIDVTEKAFEGVQRAALHFVPLRDPTNFLLQSARGLLLASRTASITATISRDADSTEPQVLKAKERASKFAAWLTRAIMQPSICDKESGFDTVTTAQGYLSYALIVLTSTLGKAFPSIINAFINSLRSPHATVKSRSLKSVLQLLERNPQILETSSGVVNTAIAAAEDSSPSVRDSALTLLSKCIALKPSLDFEICKHLLGSTADPSVAVRKKHLKLFTDIYLRNEHKAMRAAIAGTILAYVGDNETSVSELAKTTLEDIWMSPFHHLVSGNELSPQVKKRLQLHAAHVVETTNSDPGVPDVLEDLMRDLLKATNKKSAMNEAVCKAILKVMFDSIIDNDGMDDFPGQPASLRALTVFAKASPTLFDADQMVTLRPYIENLSSEDDRLVYRSVVIIYRCVLPILPPLEHKFLEGVQQTLLQSVSRLGKAELREVAPCLWMMNGVLNDTPRLAQFTLSIFKGIQNASKDNLTAQSKDVQAIKSRTQRYIRIAGPMGKAFDLAGQQAKFKEHFKQWKGDDIQGLMIDILAPFLSKSQPYEIRLEALEAVSLICQAWPHTFLKQQVIAAFELAFKDKDKKLEQVILDGVLFFYQGEEARSKTGSDIPVGDGAATGAERLGKSLGVAAHDSAATSLAERFLEDILAISRAGLDHLALVAAQVIASINRQGLVHPKQCGSALVVLETSPNQAIAKIAAEQHKDLHMKHESMLGKEYVQAIGQAFTYQRDTVLDTSGVDATGIPKLKPFFDVIKAGTLASRKKLYSDIVKKLNFNPNKSMDGLEKQLPYARFVIENFALAEYARLDEIIHLHGALEKVFTDTGNAISPSVEKLVQSLQPREDGTLPDASADTQDSTANLRPLTIATVFLTMISESAAYLRKAWSLPVAGSSKAKLAIKDVNRAPTKSASASSEPFLKRVGQARYSLRDKDTMLAQCKSFLEALSIDNDHKAASDDSADGDMGDRTGTPVGEVDGSPDHKKRKMSTSLTPGGRQEKKQRPSLPKRRSSKATSYAESDDDDAIDHLF